jgi:hypothetical protein
MPHFYYLSQSYIMKQNTMLLHPAKSITSYSSSDFEEVLDAGYSSLYSIFLSVLYYTGVID